MSMLKDYYTMEEWAEKLGWKYLEALHLARTLCLRKLGQSYLISSQEVTAIESALDDLKDDLRGLRMNE